MNFFKHGFLLVLLIHFSDLLSAQQLKKNAFKFELEPVLKYGKILKHTVNFKPEIEHPSYTAELNFIWQSKGDKEWQRMLNYPAWGLATGYTYFGNKNILGEEYFIVPKVEFRLVGNKDLQLGLEAGVGIAWLTKHYDALENSTNNVIASSINNSSSLGLKINIKANSKLSFVIGSSFTHSSTGDVRMPNLGINIPTLDFGFHYSFTKNEKGPFIRDSLTSQKRKSVVLTLRTGIGMYEIFVPDGPIYPIIINETGLGKYVGGWNKFSIGVESFYSSANYHFVQEQKIGTNYKKQSIAIAPFIQDEMEWGPVSFTMLFAYQLKQTQLSGTDMYQKLGVNHTIVSFGENNQHKISLGIFLTTHWANADYVSSLLSFQL